MLSCSDPLQLYISGQVCSLPPTSFPTTILLERLSVRPSTRFGGLCSCPLYSSSLTSLHSPFSSVIDSFSFPADYLSGCSTEQKRNRHILAAMPIYDSSARPAIYFKRISKRFQKSSSTDSPVLAPNLPPELWLHVVSQLETADASSLTLTCRSLCDIAQPALFENVVFNPFVDSDIISLDRPGVLNLRSESSYRRKLLRRLDFFSTPRIRHAVKHVCVGPSGKVSRGFHCLLACSAHIQHRSTNAQKSLMTWWKRSCMFCHSSATLHP